MIHCCFVLHNVNLLVRAFTVHVHFLLEHNSVIWSPLLKQDITAVEHVQRRFTKRLQGLRDLSYTERLRLLNLQSLEVRRLYFDLILCYRIVFGLVSVNADDFFQLNNTITRGHPAYLPLLAYSCVLYYYLNRLSCFYCSDHGKCYLHSPVTLVYSLHSLCYIFLLI